MKAIKFIAAILLLFIFTSFSTTNKNKTTQVVTHTITDYYLDCVDDYLTGTFTITIKMWGKKYQEKWKGTMTGATGIYDVSQVANENWKPYSEDHALNYTYTMTLSFEKDGMPVGVLHVLYHATMNANGEITVEVDKVVNECY